MIFANEIEEYYCDVDSSQLEYLQHHKAETYKEVITKTGEVLFLHVDINSTKENEGKVRPADALYKIQVKKKIFYLPKESLEAFNLRKLTHLNIFGYSIMSFTKKTWILLNLVMWFCFPMLVLLYYGISKSISHKPAIIALGLYLLYPMIAGGEVTGGFPAFLLVAILCAFLYRIKRGDNLEYHNRQTSFRSVILA